MFDISIPGLMILSESKLQLLRFVHALSTLLEDSKWGMLGKYTSIIISSICLLIVFLLPATETDSVVIQIAEETLEQCVRKGKLAEFREWAARNLVLNDFDRVIPGFSNVYFVFTGNFFHIF